MIRGHMTNYGPESQTDARCLRSLTEDLLQQAARVEVSKIIYAALIRPAAERLTSKAPLNVEQKGKWNFLVHAKQQRSGI